MRTHIRPTPKLHHPTTIWAVNHQPNKIQKALDCRSAENTHFSSSTLPTKLAPDTTTSNAATTLPNNTKLPSHRRRTSAGTRASRLTPKKVRICDARIEIEDANNKEPSDSPDDDASTYSVTSNHNCVTYSR